MRTVSADFGPREDNLKSEMRLDLLAQTLERLAEELFHFAAAKTDHVRMFLLAARFVVVLLAGLMHEVQLIDQATFLEQLQRPVDGNAIQLRIFFFRELIEALGIEVLTGLVDEVEQNFPLAGEAHAVIGKRGLVRGSFARSLRKRTTRWGCGSHAA